MRNQFISFICVFLALTILFAHMTQGKAKDKERYIKEQRHLKPNAKKQVVSYKSLKDQIRIIGGSTVSPHSYPSIVSIRVDSTMKGYFKHACGGVILTEHVVLTAAHCLYFKNSYNYTPKQLKLIVGEHDLSKGTKREQQRPVSKIFIYDAWIQSQKSEGKRLEGDIALLLLDWPFKLNRYVQPIKISDFSIQPGARCVIAGWGILDNESNEPSQFLQELIVEVVTLDQCRKAYDKDMRNNILETNICAGKEVHQDSCNGDSGGPLYCLNNKNKVFVGGVVSWGLAKCGEGKPGVYTNVGLYIDWIMNTLKKYFNQGGHVGSPLDSMKYKEDGIRESKYDERHDFGSNFGPRAKDSFKKSQIKERPWDNISIKGSGNHRYGSEGSESNLRSLEEENTSDNEKYSKLDEDQLYPIEKNDHNKKESGEDSSHFDSLRIFWEHIPKFIKDIGEKKKKILLKYLLEDSDYSSKESFLHSLKSKPKFRKLKLPSQNLKEFLSQRNKTNIYSKYSFTPVQFKKETSPKPLFTKNVIFYKLKVSKLKGRQYLTNKNQVILHRRIRG